MSEGRQSPPPEQQSSKQVDPSKGSGKIDNAGEKNPKDESNTTKDTVLESNPTNTPLDKAAEAKVSKDGRGPGI